jgi:hypothetical protein
VLHSFRFRLTLLFVGILALILAYCPLYLYPPVQIIHAEVASRLATQSAQLVACYSAQLHSSEEESEDRSTHVPQGELPLLPENAVLTLVGQDGCGTATGLLV